MNASLKRVIVTRLLILFALLGVVEFAIAPIRNIWEIYALKHADHARLLLACRELIANGKSYVKDYPWGWGSDHLVSVGSPIPNSVPLALRELNPEDILISTNCVMIYLGRGMISPRLSLLAFRKDARQYGSFNYIDGLWFWNGNMNQNEMQRINGTNF